METKALKAKRPGFTDERYMETAYFVENGALLCAASDSRNVFITSLARAACEFVSCCIWRVVCRRVISARISRIST